MTKKQFNTRLPEELLKRFNNLEGTNTANAEEAIRMLLEARGMGSESDIEREIRKTDDDINDIRNAALEKMAEKQKRRDDLTTMLEHRQSEQSSCHDIIAQIVDGMAANPDRTIEGFRSEVDDLLSRTGITHTREDIIADVRAYAREHDIEIRPHQLASGASTNTPTVAADGASDGEQPIDTSRYDFGSDDE